MNIWTRTKKIVLFFLTLKMIVIVIQGKIKIFTI